MYISQERRIKTEFKVVSSSWQTQQSVAKLHVQAAFSANYVFKYAEWFDEMSHVHMHVHINICNPTQLIMHTMYLDIYTYIAFKGYV